MNTIYVKDNASALSSSTKSSMEYGIPNGEYSTSEDKECVNVLVRRCLLHDKYVNYTIIIHKIYCLYLHYYQSQLIRRIGCLEVLCMMGYLR